MTANLQSVMQVAVKQIAFLLSRAGMDGNLGMHEGSAASADRDEPKKFDVVAVSGHSACSYIGMFTPLAVKHHRQYIDSGAGHCRLSCSE